MFACIFMYVILYVRPNVQNVFNLILQLQDRRFYMALVNNCIESLRDNNNDQSHMSTPRKIFKFYFFKIILLLWRSCP